MQPCPEQIAEMKVSSHSEKGHPHVQKCSRTHVITHLTTDHSVSWKPADTVKIMKCISHFVQLPLDELSLQIINNVEVTHVIHSDEGGV